ncbi:MAG: 30S ribosomal protein S12 methylthiotransferase RimO [Candidatus Melainabacteria bacterium]|jgi:ribosomal protein S12 methylthiotransferase|nr:30S ribosomal protein S12 methylthiotransferase RimO [Candidatus Melainabacteria bacterium]
MTTKTAKKLPVIGVSTLGCPKNLVDTENIIGILHGAGYQITADHDKADLSLVNTCTFIEDSTNESIEVLGALADAGQKLIITGCMAQRYKGDLFDELPEAQAVVGTGNVKDILDVVRQVTAKMNAGEDAKIICVDEKPTSVADALTPRIHTQVSPSSYLKIAEGCDHRCAFCIIPHLRGDMNSRTIEDVVAEAKILVERGAQEIVLVSQDSTAYGTDIYKRRALADLLDAVATESGAKWIRVMYAYPTEMDEAMLEVIAKHDNIMNYIDIPLQHASRDVLLRMKRPPTVRDTFALIKDKLPGVCVRTTFIAGFPGETDEDFQELYSFIEDSRFDRVGIFTYSKEMGTAAYDLADQVPDEIKQERRDKLMQLQQKISLEKNQELLGKELTVLLEDIVELEDGGYQLVSRSYRDAPEIDGQVYCELDAETIVPAPGSFIQVKVVDCDEYDLFGELKL